MVKSPFQTVEEYIKSFPPEVQEKLRTMRKIIQETAPAAIEKLSWGMPSYYLNGFLVQFAAFQKHIGFYTTPATIHHFVLELRGYKTNAKNTAQFLLTQELPVDLIEKMILFRVRENQNCT